MRRWCWCWREDPIRSPPANPPVKRARVSETSADEASTVKGAGPTGGALVVRRCFALRERQRQKQGTEQVPPSGEPRGGGEQGGKPGKLAARKAAAKKKADPPGCVKPEEPPTPALAVAQAKNENLARAETQEQIGQTPGPQRAPVAPGNAEARGGEAVVPKEEVPAEPVPTTEKKGRKTKTESEKATHARYMRFSRSLKSNLAANVSFTSHMRLKHVPCMCVCASWRSRCRLGPNTPAEIRKAGRAAAYCGSVVCAGVVCPLLLNPPVWRKC